MVSVSEFSTGVLMTVFEYHRVNLNSVAAGVISKSEVGVFGLWGTAEYDICYVYTISEKKHVGCRVRYDLRLCDGCDVLKKYPLGREVTVYYDSAKHDYSSLEKGSLGKGVYRQLAVLIIVYPVVLLIGFLYRDLGRKERRIKKGKMGSDSNKEKEMGSDSN